MLPQQNHPFGAIQAKPSQSSVPAGLTLASVFGFCFQCQVGSSLVLRRPIETTALSLTTPTVSRDFILIVLVSTNTPFLWHASRVSVAALFHLCHPNSLGPFSLHRFGVAHQTSLRSRSTMMSYAISPQGGGSPNQSDGDFSHHNAVLAFPHRQHHFSVASVHDDRTLGNRSGPAT